MTLYPQGTVAQVERGRAHREFVDAVKPPYVLLKIQYARRLLDAGETASSRFPDQTQVITSTAIRDNRNEALPLEHNGYKRGEVDIIREFEPDIHIPADRSDYADIEDAERYREVKKCMTGTVAMVNHVEDYGLDTRILPFLKGVRRKERWLCYRTIEQLGLDYAAFYANNYFNDGTGVRIDDLVEDLHTVTDESRELVDSTDRPLRLCVLNCLSPNVLKRFPNCVEAASGLWVGQNRGWREKVVPTKQSPKEMRRIFYNVQERVAEALPKADVSRERNTEGTEESKRTESHP